jgi:hypothetical protein
MVANKFDYNRLIYLNQKIKDNSATKPEKDEYMNILYDNGNISQEQYDSYLLNNSMQEEIIKAALIIGGIILIAYLLEKLLSN